MTLVLLGHKFVVLEAREGGRPKAVRGLGRQVLWPEYM